MMINFYGKFELSGFVKLAGCDTSECQLSVLGMLLDDEKLYSETPSFLLFVTTFPTFPRSIDAKDKLKIRDHNIAGIHIMKEVSSVNKIDARAAVVNTKMYVFIFVFFNTPVINRFLSLYLLLIFSSSLNIFMFFIANNIIVTNEVLTDERIPTNGLLITIDTKITEDAVIVSAIKNNILEYLSFNSFNSAISLFFISLPFLNISKLIITPSLASRSEYARK